MDNQEAVIRNLQGDKERRRREPNIENGYENGEYGDDEEGLTSEFGLGRHREVRANPGG